MHLSGPGLKKTLSKTTCMFIQIVSEYNAELTVELLDSQGRVVLSQSYYSNTTLQLSELSEGLYVLRFKDGGKWLGYKNIVVK